MRKVEEETFVCVDCESTGLNPAEDRMIEVAVVIFRGKEHFETFSALVNPEHAISAESGAVHNITAEMLQGQPAPGEVLPKVFDLIADHPIVGHYVQFDILLLKEEAKRAKIPCSISKNQMVDTLRLARHYGESPVNSLGGLQKHFHVEERTFHRALDDVLVNIDVFHHLTRRYKTLKQMYQALAKPALIRTMPFGKYKGRLFSELPLNYLTWLSHQNYDEDLAFTIRQEKKKRRKGNTFGQASNPFKGL